MGVLERLGGDIAIGVGIQGLGEESHVLERMTSAGARLRGEARMRRSDYGMCRNGPLPAKAGSPRCAVPVIEPHACCRRDGDRTANGPVEAALPNGKE